MTRIAAALAAALCFSLAAPAFGQTFPSRALRLICPFPPAGAVDIASRAIANELQKIFGRPVTVENRPGAGGNVGGEVNMMFDNVPSSLPHIEIVRWTPVVKSSGAKVD